MRWAFRIAGFAAAVVWLWLIVGQDVVRVSELPELEPPARPADTGPRAPASLEPAALVLPPAAEAVAPSATGAGARDELGETDRSKAVAAGTERTSESGEPAAPARIRIGGVVVDDLDRPVARATILRIDRRGSSTSARGIAMTGDDGTFAAEIDSGGESTVLLSAGAAGRFQSAERSARDGEHDIRFVLCRRGAVRVRVLLGEPALVREIEVETRHAADEGWQSADPVAGGATPLYERFAAQSGRHDVRVLMHRTETVVAHLTGVRFPAEEDSDAAEALVVDLRGRFARRRIAIADELGAPVPGAVVRYRPSGDPGAVWAREAQGPGGVAELLAVAGPLDVQIDADRRESAVLLALERDATVRLGPGYPVELALSWDAPRDAGLLLDVVLTAEGLPAPTEVRAWVDPEGRASAWLAYPGRHSIRLLARERGAEDAIACAVRPDAIVIDGPPGEVTELRVRASRKR